MWKKYPKMTPVLHLCEIVSVNRNRSVYSISIRCLCQIMLSMWDLSVSPAIRDCHVAISQEWSLSNSRSRQHSTDAVTNLQGTLYRIKIEFSVSHVSQSTESHFCWVHHCTFIFSPDFLRTEFEPEIQIRMTRIELYCILSHTLTYPRALSK